MRKMKLKNNPLSWFFGLVVGILCLFLATNPAFSAPTPERAQVGNLDLTLMCPEGMVPVLGLSPRGDAFFYSLNEKFKLIVLGAYARPEEYLDFVAAMERGEFRHVPNIALITVPRKMGEKSYDAKGATKELKRYVRWFTLATNTKPIAWGFEIKANKVLEKKLGMDFDFSYRTSGHTKIFNQSPTSVGMGVLTSVYLYGQRSENYLGALAFQVSDKFVFLSMVGLDRTQGGVDSIRNHLLSWRDSMAAVNPPPLGESGVGEASLDDNTLGG
ncbi:MAG: hypothetical protein LBE38_11565 [Deltaproteobacteria bacterium]|jgi:hypothetical protein|nr:hypothetical protein [Deltaproteobacteria bacterium]